MTDFDSLDAALDAAIERPRCRSICSGQHEVAVRIGDRIRTIDASAAIVRRDIRRAIIGDLAAIHRLEANLPPQQPKRSTS